MTALVLLLLAPLDPARGQQDDHPGVRASYEAVGKAFVGVDVHLRKKTRLEKADLDEETQDPELQRLTQLADAEQPLETWAVAVDKNLLLMAERGLRPDAVERIDCVDASGTRFEAKLEAVGRNFDFVLLKPVKPLEFVPLVFGDWAPPKLGESFHVTYADRAEGRWHLNVSPYIQTNAPLVPEKGWFCLDPMRLGAVVSDAKGAPVGLALDAYLWTREDGRSSFLGKAVVADERLGDLDARYAALRKALGESVKRVEISLRADRPQERFAAPEDPRAGRLTVFGLLLDAKGSLLVPDGLPRDTVRRIEDISVNDGGRSLPATFVASFRSFGALLLRAEGLAGKPLADLAAAAPAPGALFVTAAVDDRFGRSRLRFDYNRLFRMERGLEGVDRLRPRFRIKGGSLLLDLDGRVIGFATADKKEEDLDELAMEGARERLAYERYRPSYTPDHLRRLVFFSEIAPALAAPAAHADAKAVPMTKKDEKRLVWLGVEYQELNKPLAEALGIQERDLSNDGRRGLLVTELYADSPAEKAGLRLDDVLLTVRPAGEGARDLAGETDRFGGAFPRGRAGRANPGDSLWKPTKNYLTSMLTEIGAGKKVSIEYLRAREKKAVELTLEQAPPDSETAEREKDEVLGFTAKELTYEVRHFQKLERGQTGVLVQRVESGGRADVAKLPVLSIVTRVNGVAVRDLAHFKALLAASRSLTLTTVLFGQTKLVELARD